MYVCMYVCMYVVYATLALLRVWGGGSRQPVLRPVFATCMSHPLIHDSNLHMHV